MMICLQADSVDALEVKGNIAGAQAELELLETSLTVVQAQSFNVYSLVVSVCSLRTLTTCKPLRTGAWTS